MLEAVVDTNVFVSALTGGRVTSPVYTALKLGKFRLLLSPDLILELLTVLSRREFGLTDDELEQFRTFLFLHAKFVEPRSPVTVCRDPADNRILFIPLSGVT